MRDLLHHLGMRRIFEASDGAEAVGLLGAVATDLLVVDWNLPVVGALDFVQLARGATPAGAPFTPVVLTMAEPRRKAVADAVEAGITNIVVKPYAARLMRSRLEQARRPGPR